MKILIITDKPAFSPDDPFAARVTAEAEASGYAALPLILHNKLMVNSLRAMSSPDLRTLGAGELFAVSNDGAIAEFCANVLLVYARADDQPRVELAIKPFLAHFLTTYTAHPAADGRLHLTNIGTKKVFKIAPDDIAKLVNIIRSETVSNARLFSPRIDADSAAFNDLARAEIALRQYSRTLPYRAKELRLEPATSVGGALESLADEEVVLEKVLWLKGWIDWNEKTCARLVARIQDEEYEIEVEAFRSDKYVRGSVENPMVFSARIDIDRFFSANTVSLYVEEKTGLRSLWCTRRIWISHDVEAQSETPLISGSARIIDGNRVAFSVSCDGVPIDRVVAWQGGSYIGCWNGSGALNLRDAAFDIFPLRASGAFINLHVHLAGRGFVPWLCLSLTTGDLAAFSGFDHVHVVEDDRFALEIDADPAAFPVSVLLDGKLVSVASHARTLEIGLEACAGMATVQTIDQSGHTVTWRLWRHCRGAATGAKLPAFVLPPQAAHERTPGFRDRRPRLLLLRQTSAPTDELYLLCALEQIAQSRDFTLDIVDLDGDATTEEDRERLLADGTFVIISRYLSTPWIEALSRRRDRLGQIFYIMDDDVTLAENDIGMPGGYRKRMIGVAHSEFQTLLHLSTRFLVTSEFLAGRFDSAKTDLITPPYIRPIERLDHLEDMSEIRIEYHGTQVHRMDLDAIASALIWIHDQYPHVKIRTYMGKFAPDRFKAYKRIEIVPDIPWEDYKAAVAASPAHIALAPMLESPYNKAKSFVKIMDIARLGAAGLYSRRAPYDSVITHNETGLLLENDALIWRYALAWLIDNPDEIKRLARAGQEMTAALGDIAILRRYWEAQLFGTPDVATQAPAGPTAAVRTHMIQSLHGS